MKPRAPTLPHAPHGAFRLLSKEFDEVYDPTDVDLEEFTDTARRMREEETV